MGGFAPNSGSTIRSRLDARNPSVLSSVNDYFPGAYSTDVDGARNEDRDGFFTICWRRFCGKCRSSNRSDSSGSYNGLLCGCYTNEEYRPELLTLFYWFTKSTFWFVLFSSFSIFLLFGPAIQTLIDTGRGGDLAFLYLRIIMLFFFVLDMLVRCVAEENYFTLTICGRKDSNTNNGDAKEVFFSAGSFLFWCDFLSTMSILYDLSFINNHHFDPILYEMHLTSALLDYQSLSGFKLNSLSPNSLEANLLIVILRTARCARFVQSRTAVNAFNRYSCYGFLRWLNPCFYYNLLKVKRVAQKQNIDADDIDNVSVISAATVDSRRGKSKNTLESITLSSYNIRIEDQGNGERKIQKQSEEELTRRREAAIKIQRTWRDRVQCASDDQFLVSTRSMNSAMLKPALAPFNERNVTNSEISDDITQKSRFQIEAGKTYNQSQVRSDMRQSTGKRVAVGILLILIFTLLCTYAERTTTQIKIMIVLHTQTKTPAYIDRSLRAAVNSSAPRLYAYSPAVETKTYYPNPNFNGTGLTLRNKLNITVTERIMDIEGTSIGLFDNSVSVKEEALVDLIATFFIILLWFAGVVSFCGPVAILVITPVEQMLRLLGMLTLNPLGYQSTPMYKNFLRDEESMGKNTGWSRDVLKGMETSFLQSNILRIGSLMKVGFGSAGVEIIQNNLETGQNQNRLILNSQGTTVSCIFLFCDIRQFTDATEQLQEEVFVFTNQIAAVVHSICSSYGGAANKNVGDAFLLSWSLDEKGRNSGNGPLRAKTKQADKALLSVIKICISLAYDSFFLEPLSRAATGRLKSKLKDRIGPVVQMGFGLHAGEAVQGAIGTQRKIDATYVAESVERAEFLESSTKKYKLNMLMSGEFHELLNSRNRERSRKIDQVLKLDQGHGCSGGEFMNLYTFDMDVNALQQSHSPNNGSLKDAKNLRQSIRNRRRGYGQRKNVDVRDNVGDDSNINTKKEWIHSIYNQPNFDPLKDKDSDHESRSPPALVLPDGPALYSKNVWSSYDIRKIRQKYDGSPYFFHTFSAGLEAFYDKEWNSAKKHFLHILENFDDGPSKYFLAHIDENNGIPPQDFKSYGVVD